MKSIFITFILYSLGSICVAQKNKKGDQINTLSLEKKTPLEITSYPKNRCGTYPLLKLLRDSLTKEGFTVVDSMRSKSLQESFLSKDLMSASSLVGKSPEEIKASSERMLRSKKVVQELSIENFSCLDTLHRYTIRVYLFPRPRAEEKSLSFTLPFSSPYRISDIILSLIEREPTKR